MSMKQEEKFGLRLQLANALNPTSPIDSYSLFAGRAKQINQLFRTVGQTGEHAIIYGERGVGKTSLANVLREILANLGIKKITAVKVNCEVGDSFEALWQRIFRELLKTYQPAENEEEIMSLPTASLGPDDVRYFLQRFPESTIIVIDELDRIKDRQITSRLADTIKTLSDNGLKATLVLIGVADSVDEIITDHKSIERALVQILMPFMSTSELEETIQKGLTPAKMSMKEEAYHYVTRLSQGLPYYTRSLTLYAAEYAIDRDCTIIEMSDVQKAIAEVVGRTGHSNVQKYLDATRSSHKDSLYAPILLACAFTNADDLGYFSTADVREPLSRITKRPYEIPAYARHLNEFCESGRGQVLKKVGAKRRYKYRFSDPQMRPYVTMQGLAKGLIDRTVWSELSGLN